MLKTRNLLWLIPLGLLITFPIWKHPIASFLEPRGGYDQNFGKQDKNIQNFMMDNVIIIQDQAGHKTAIVRADKAFTTDTPNEFQLDIVDADLFSEDDEKVTITATSGIYNTESKQLTLVKNVIVSRSSENQKLFSELLYYYDHNRTIQSPGDTRLIGDSIEVRGGSLDYDIVSSRYEVGGRVYCTIDGFK